MRPTLHKKCSWISFALGSFVQEQICHQVVQALPYLNPVIFKGDGKNYDPGDAVLFVSWRVDLATGFDPVPSDAVGARYESVSNFPFNSVARFYWLLEGGSERLAYTDTQIYNHHGLVAVTTVCECICRRVAVPKSVTGLPQDLQITPYAVTPFRSYDPDWHETTPELNYELESEMANFPQYTFNTVNILCSVGVTQFLALPGNSQRMTLIVCSEATVFRVHTKSGESLGRSMADGAPNTTLVLPYRDYGPAIRGEIFVSAINGGSTVNVTEVVELS